MTTGSAETNPFKDPLAGLYGDVSELMASLTDDEMLELHPELGLVEEETEEGLRPLVDRQAGVRRRTGTASQGPRPLQLAEAAHSIGLGPRVAGLSDT
jgi:hypothetical protein